MWLLLMAEYLYWILKVAVLIGFNYASWKAVDAFRDLLIHYKVI